MLRLTSCRTTVDTVPIGKLASVEKGNGIFQQGGRKFVHSQECYKTVLNISGHLRQNRRWYLGLLEQEPSKHQSSAKSNHVKSPQLSLNKYCRSRSNTRVALAYCQSTSTIDQSTGAFVILRLLIGQFCFTVRLSSFVRKDDKMSKRIISYVRATNLI